MDGAMVLVKLPVPKHPTDLDCGRTRAYCACSICGWGLLGHFFSLLSFFLLSRRPDIDWNTVSKAIYSKTINQSFTCMSGVVLYFFIVCKQ